MNKTKIICTLGPASSTITTIKKLINAGMDVARINMSHSNHKTAEKLFTNARKARESLNKSVALMVDTKGPEIRISTFKNGKVELKKSQFFSLLTYEEIGDEKKVSLKYTNLIKQVKIGQKIFANNAQIVLKVVKILENEILTKVLFGGILSNNKALNIPKIAPKVDFLSQEDKDDLIFAIKEKVSFVAASFVSCEKDVLDLRSFLDNNGGQKVKIISKIENDIAVKNLEKIILKSDGIMVARGDLGVDIPMERLPLIQKMAVEKAIFHGKIVVIATEMLESMTHSLRPTRAEVSDVAGAVFEMATATMLSGESAVGINPENVVKTMSKIQRATEKNMKYYESFLKNNRKITSISDAISKSVCTNAIELKAKLIIVFTHSGESARLVSRYRISTPIFALTPFEEVYYNLALQWNTQPYLIKDEKFESEEEMQQYAKNLAVKKGLVKSGDKIIIQHGRVNQKATTDMLKVITI